MKASTTTIAPTPPATPKPRGRKFPYRARTVAESLVINPQISKILDGINDMIFGIARKEMKGWQEQAIQDMVQECRTWLWRKSLPKYNNWRRPRVKVSTFLHSCASNFILQKRRTVTKQIKLHSRAEINNLKLRNTGFPRDHVDKKSREYGIDSDRKIEVLAQHIMQNPEQYLTRSQAETFKALMNNPDLMMKDLAGVLDYKRVSSLSTIKRRIFERIKDIDIDGFDQDSVIIRPTKPKHRKGRTKRDRPAEAATTDLVAAAA